MPNELENFFNSQPSAPKNEPGTKIKDNVPGNSKEPSKDQPIKDNVASEEFATLKAENERLKLISKKLDTFAPVIETMEKDPNFVNHLSEYFKNGGKPKGIELPEDFELDMTEAVKDPTSPSGQVLRQMINAEASRLVQESAVRSQRVQTLQAQVNELKEKYNLSNEQISELETFAKSRQQNLEDVYFLWQKDKGNFVDTERNKIKSESEHQLRLRQFPVSQANRSNAEEYNPNDPAAMDEAFGQMLVNAFGGGFNLGK
jgi:uncharacterized protein YfkK (UPF0435 family)